MKHYQSWGRIPPTFNQKSRMLLWRDRLEVPEGRVLPYGLGRSYGDCCLNEDGILLDTGMLDHFMAFDPASGRLRCEAGVTLDAILKFAVPRGWFIPVSPGTKYVTVGGAIANDVHGKNHHCAGTFGSHVKAFELLRSNGVRLLCRPEEHTDYFNATVGGLGLTGLIVWAEIQLQPVKNSWVDTEAVQFGSLDEFFEISRASGRNFAYTVAWLDCVSGGAHFGRGIFMRGNHCTGACSSQPHSQPKISIPFDFPGFALNNLSVRLFNLLYYHKQWKKLATQRQHYNSFFYPLDSVLEWNRIYGKKGFYQFQCVIPPANAKAALQELLKVIVESGQGSFLAVLKEFGSISSPGLLSFPRPGVTLCLDFQNRGDRTLKLLKRLEAMVVEWEGALYPAKDACMSAASFQRFYPQWSFFSRLLDPRFSSSFWRRVTAGA